MKIVDSPANSTSVSTSYSSVWIVHDIIPSEDELTQFDAAGHGSSTDSGVRYQTIEEAAGSWLTLQVSVVKTGARQSSRCVLVIRINAE